MIEVLQYEGKNHRNLYDISTPEKRAKAFSLLFMELDDWGVYTDLNKDEKVLLKKARKGSSEAIEELLWARSEAGCEYEDISLITLINPLEVDES